MERRKLLPYAGGKSRLAPRLLKLMPEHECYCEVFGGGAALLAAKDPKSSATEVLNDIDGRTVNLYRVAQRHPEALRLEVSLAIRSREMYLDWREHQGETDIQRAARYLFCLINTFGNATQMQSFATSTTRPMRWHIAGADEIIAHIYGRLDGVTVEHLDFGDCLRRYDRPSTFFYLDPPYYLVNVPYQCGMAVADHARLADCLRAVGGKWLLSYNDVPEVRALYKGFHMEAVEVAYTICRDKGPRRPGRELLIRNY